MNRAILIFAAALLGTTGCYSKRCDPTSMTVNWEFTDAAGLTRDCGRSGPTSVRVFIDGVAQVDSSGNPDFTCAQYPYGVVLYDFANGSYALQLEAYGSSGQLLYMDQRQVSIARCGDTPVLATLTAAQGPMAIEYAIANAGSQCPAGSYLWLSITDLTNRDVFAQVDGTHAPTSVPCGTPLVYDEVPFGELSLDFIQVVQPTANPNAPYAALFQQCTPVPIHHLGAETVQVTLAPAMAFCR